MRISTNEFLLGSLNDMLNQQSNVNQLNREIATGQTLLDASHEPGGRGQALGAANSIAQYYVRCQPMPPRRPSRCRPGSARCSR